MEEEYFKKYIEPLDTPEQYLHALDQSPYLNHRREAARLRKELNEITNYNYPSRNTNKDSSQ